jgi:hypothetical protein
VAADEAARGTGLGRAVRDAAIDAMPNRNGPGAIVESAAANNAASRRMIEGSGPARRDDVVTSDRHPGGAAARGRRRPASPTAWGCLAPCPRVCRIRLAPSVPGPSVPP